MTDWDNVRLTAHKVAYWVPVELDADGTPLEKGERMVEVEPGQWVHPTLAAILKFLDDGSGDW
jgi:hypothetical protein